MKRNIAPMDELDGLLAGFFRPGSFPEGLGRRIINGARAMGPQADLPGEGASGGREERLRLACGDCVAWIVVAPAP